MLDKFAARVAPASVKRRLAEKEAEREQQEQAWREEQAARLAARRATLEAGEPVRCECCLRPIESAADAAEKHGALVHAGDCERQWAAPMTTPTRPTDGADPPPADAVSRLDSTQGTYASLRCSRVTREPIGRGLLRPSVASIGDLARMLAALGREQDLSPLRQLRTLAELERSLIRGIER